MIKSSKQAGSKSTTLYCFTPMVTLMTFMIEGILGLMAMYRYRHTLFGKLAVWLIFFLAFFQISEYLVCGTSQFYPWSTIGWICITFLPAIGLHMTSLLTKKTWWVSFGYLMSLIFTIYFVSVGQPFSAVDCPGNFVHYIFESALLGFIYPIYYAWFLLLALVRLGGYYLQGGPTKTIIGWFIGGYFSFMIPTTLVYIILPAPLESFPSVFCGFAVLLALIMVVKILPAYEDLNKKNN